MKQIFQSLKTGNTQLVELPISKPDKGFIAIETTHSLVSLGTEKMLVDFGKANLIQKAKQQPEKMKMVLDKIYSEGLIPTIEAIFSKLEEPIPLGYCNVGRVVDIGSEVKNFSIGDRVASNGSHAEIVVVPENLAHKIPDSVSDEEATFTVVGAIALQGIRLLQPSFGESVVVIGLGLIGQLTCQLLRANGCNVIGIDIDKKKCDSVKKFGVATINSSIENPVTTVQGTTNFFGADGVIITASAKTNNIISDAAKLTRKRGKIILVGVVGLELNRSDFYEKEISFQVSCSYGPGRYDNVYEQKGVDYPFPYVRWTENRNFGSVLQAIDDKALNVKGMISRKVKFENFNDIYENLDDSKVSLLVYPKKNKYHSSKNTIILKDKKHEGRFGNIGIIGAGNFTKRKIIPSLIGLGAELKIIASKSGKTGTQLAKKFSIENSTTDYNKIIDDQEIDIVFITTRHSNHASLVIDTLNTGKLVFVEKPLALNYTELDQIFKALQNNARSNLVVGFNRRFSPHLKKIKESLGTSEIPINIIATMNAGFIPKSHWVNDFDLEGGRIIGEACHMLDACVYLSGSKIKSVCMNSLGTDTDLSTENASILLKFINGSNAVINYFSNGSKKFSKEKIEVYAKESTWINDNYKKTHTYNVKNFKVLNTKSDKGHANQFKELLEYVKNGGKPLIPYEELFNVTKATFDAIKSLRENKWINV